MENLFLKNLKVILLQYFLFKLINLDFSKIFFDSFFKNEILKFPIFLDKFKNFSHFLRMDYIIYMICLNIFQIYNISIIFNFEILDY